MVEHLQGNTRLGSGADHEDSGGSGSGNDGAWSDVGIPLQEDEKRVKWAEVTNVAQLHAQIKHAKEDLRKAECVGQKETELRVRLDSELKVTQAELNQLKQKLELAEQERRDLLAQVSTMTHMVDSKNKEAQSQVESLTKRYDKLKDEHDQLTLEYSQQRQLKDNWEEKYKDKSEDFSQLQRELERKENRFYHDMREKETQIRKLRLEIMQLQMNNPKLTDSGGASPGAVNTSSHSSEAEMKQLVGGPVGDMPDMSPTNAPYGTIEDVWSTLPVAGGGRAPRWTEEKYDSPPSSGMDSSYHQQQEFGAGRRVRQKSRGDGEARRKAGDPYESGGDEGGGKTKDRRSRSRGGRSDRQRSPSPVDQRPKRRTKSKGRTPLDYPSYPPPPFDPFMGGPGPFDPYYGPPPPEIFHHRAGGRRGYYYSSGGSGAGGRSPPPPSMPLVSGVPPPGVKDKPLPSKQRPKS